MQEQVAGWVAVAWDRDPDAVAWVGLDLAQEGIAYVPNAEKLSHTREAHPATRSNARNAVTL